MTGATSADDQRGWVKPIHTKMSVTIDDVDIDPVHGSRRLRPDLGHHEHRGRQRGQGERRPHPPALPRQERDDDRDEHGSDACAHDREDRPTLGPEAVTVRDRPEQAEGSGQPEGAGGVQRGPLRIVCPSHGIRHRRHPGGVDRNLRPWAVGPSDAPRPAPYARPVLVEIYSDVVCPWCYIGQHQFGKALTMTPAAALLDVVWRAFQLDPRARSEPTSVRDAYARKFGGEERADAVIARLSEAAAAVGLELRMDRALRANTFDAHRLVWLAGTDDRQWEVERRLMEAYFRDGRNVADRSTLAEIAEGSGFQPREVERFLAGPGGVAEVRAELESATEPRRARRPHLLLREHVGIPGAQEPETFVRVIERAVSRLEDSGSAPGR